ncbi:MAG: hypothetical protein AAFP15_15785 [Bacteroidota bacterium]
MRSYQQLTKEDRIAFDLVDYTPHIEEDDTYWSFLDSNRVLGRGFSYGELVKPRRRDRALFPRHAEPPEDLWHRMVLTLAAANELRGWLTEGDHAPRGLRVAAAYRPRGGSKRSQHKQNAALDLDLMPGDYHHTHRLYETAVRFWCEHGRNLKMGLGLYPAGQHRRDGIRIHIDTGYRCRSWQITGGRSRRPYLVNGRRVGLPVFLAHDLGLVPPTEAA